MTTAAVERQALPILVSVALVVPAVVWAILDRSIWPWDPAWYGEVSIDLWSSLRLNYELWPLALQHAFGSKPPAIAWLGQFFVPFGGLVGGDQVALLLSVVACQAASLALLFVAARRLTGGSSLLALVAALLTGSAPLFVSMSHEYFVEPIQTLSVAWVLFIMASASRWHPSLTAVQLIGAASFGVLAKVSTPLYMIAPGLVAVVLAARASYASRDWWLDRAFLASSAVSTALVFGAVSWYRVNLSSAIEHGRLATDSTLYGTKAAFPAKLHQWTGWFRDAAFLPYFDVALLLLLVAGAVSLLVARHVPERALPAPRALALAACLATPILVLSLLARRALDEVRFLLPLVPFLALATAVLLRELGSRLLSLAVAGLLAMEFALVTFASFGTAPDAFAYARMKAPTADSSFAGELRQIVSDTCTSATAGKISMVGGEYPSLNHNTLELLAFERFAQSGRRCYYTSLGYAEPDPAAALRRVREFEPPYYISIDYGNPKNPLSRELATQVRPGDPFNKVNLAVYRRVLSSGAFTVVPGSRRNGLVVLRASR